MSILIIGSGMAGFGAAYELSKHNIKPVMFEEKPYYGGHTASFRSDDGFIFDDGPHISFTKNERIQKLFAESVNNEYEVLQANVNNYWKGYWIKHPAQVNLFGLPKDLVKQIILEFIENKYSKRDGNTVENYRDWLYRQFGKTFTETFPMEYGYKYHTATADNMSTDWLGVRIYTPDIAEVLEGALSEKTPDVHYVDHFRYPTNNGFVSYLNKFIHLVDLHLNRKVIRVYPKQRELLLSDGTRTSYTSLISSVPLPDIISMIEWVPRDVQDAASRLACTSCITVNIGINRNDLSNSHWLYFYDRDFIFTRLSFPHLYSPNNVPKGAGSIQAEIYYSDKYKPVDRKPDECIEPVLNDLRRCGLVKPEDKILHTSTRFVKYANVIYDLERRDALATVQGYLDEQGILYCGRYGDWGYHWTDEAFESGENAALKIINK
jgi:protoporphyrinogen oxidase